MAHLRHDNRERETPTQTPPQPPTTTTSSSSSAAMKEYADSGYNSSPPSLRSFMATAASSTPASSSTISNTTHPEGVALPTNTILPNLPPSNVFPPIPPALQAHIDALDPGTDHFDRDSAYDSESLLGDDTVTLASYITDYRYENGRRYHAYRDGAYWVRVDFN